MLPAQSLSVLVIDDEPEMADMISFCLQRKGAKVTTCTRGRIAVSLVKQARFDLIICDLKMPEWDGLETVEALRKLVRDTPIVMASGYADEHTTAEARNLGVVEQLAKPFTVDELYAMVDRVVGRRRRAQI